MTVYPGPQRIDPGLCPGGIVIHIYDVPSEELLLVRPLRPVEPVEMAAELDAEFVMALTPNCCLVSFDGDTGERIRPFPLPIRLVSE